MIIIQDWDPRGELIRVQIALTKGVEDKKEYEKLKSREGELLEIIGQNHLHGTISNDIKFYNGLPDSYFNLSHNELTTPQQAVNIFRNLVDLPSLRSLYFTDSNVNIESIKILVNSNLTNLLFLDLSRNWINNQCVKLLAKSHNFQKLLSLRLENNQIDDLGVQLLAKSVSFPNLTDLNLGYNNFTEEGVRIFANSKNYKKLINIDLASIHINNTTSLRNDFAKNFPALKNLYIGNLSFRNF